MVGRSDIEEIEIDDNNSGDNYDSSYSETRPTRGRGRPRKKSHNDPDAVTVIDPGPKVGDRRTNKGMMYKKRSQRIIDKERDEFLSEFDKSKSERERRKKSSSKNYREIGRGKHSKLTKNLKFLLHVFIRFLC